MNCNNITGSLITWTSSMFPGRPRARSYTRQAIPLRALRKWVFLPRLAGFQGRCTFILPLARVDARSLSGISCGISCGFTLVAATWSRRGEVDSLGKRSEKPLEATSGLTSASLGRDYLVLAFVFTYALA